MIEPLSGPVYPTIPYPRELSCDSAILGILAQLWDETTDLPNPFYNNGVCYATENFILQSYIWDWSEDIAETETNYWLNEAPNFLYIPLGAAAGWYKHCARGVNCNKAFKNMRVKDILPVYQKEVLDNLPEKRNLYIYKASQ